MSNIYLNFCKTGNAQTELEEWFSNCGKFTDILTVIVHVYKPHVLSLILKVYKYDHAKFFHIH